MRLVTVATGLDSPVDVAGIPGTTKLAVVEKTGRVLVVTDGHPAPKPLLDLRGQVSQGSEQGLLSIVFSPRYAKNGLAYVDYTDLDGNTHVAQLDTRSGSLRTILFVHQPFSNHNGGALAFGPDGMLYVGMGDGGSEGDPEGNGQNRASLLGKILWLDVAKPNPRPQMYAYGLRNPWRFSFDPATGDLWIGDVGQNRYEEVDHLAAGTPPGANLGWNAYEGRAVYKPQPIDRSRLVWPVAVYPHSEGCSITGGYVYRGNRRAGAARPLRLRRLLQRPDLVASPTRRQPAAAGAAQAGGPVLVRPGRTRRAVRDHPGRPRPSLRPGRIGYRRAPAHHSQRATPAGIAGGAVGRRSRSAASHTSWPASSCTGPAGPALTPPGCGLTSLGFGAATSAAPRWPTRS